MDSTLLTKLVDMILAQLCWEKVSTERSKRTRQLVQSLISGSDSGVLENEYDPLMADGGRRRDNKVLQLAFLKSHLPGKGKPWPASFNGLFPCERCCKATDNYCKECSNRVAAVCEVCETKGFKCFTCMT